MSVDAAVKNIDGRVTANAADIATVTAEAANALNSVSSASTTGYVTLSVGTKAAKTQAISVAVDTAKSGAEIENATPSADKLVPAVALKNYAEKFATATSVTALETAVAACVTAEAASETEYGEWDAIVNG